MGRRKLLLAVSVSANLGVLGFFKYFNFFAESFASLLSSFGMRADVPTLHILLPLGISFYTFLSLSYTLDVYRGKLRAATHPTDFLLYVSFFPHLVAGPIMRAQDLLPQCQRPRVIRREQIHAGIWLCLLGYFKKVVIADRLGDIATWGFDGGGTPYTDANSWIPIYAFAFQIYGDFSGYSDIARGLSKLMGFELVRNFKAPYLVSNPAEFWRNWHISLSTWLRDYLYIPLGGNRHGRILTTRNLMLTMILGGLWHGAGIAFLAWGFYQGTLLVAHRLWLGITGRFPATLKEKERPARLLAACGRALVVVVFFHLTCLGWLLFRAGTVPKEISQWGVIQSFLSTLWIPPQQISIVAWPVLVLGASAMFLQWKDEDSERFATWHPAVQATAVAVILYAITAFGVFDGSTFIYFQF